MALASIPSSTGGGSYRNPRQQTLDLFDVYQKQQQNLAAKGQLLVNNIELNQKEKKAQKELYEQQQFEEQVKAQTKISGINVGHKKMDDNLHEVLQGIQDKIFKVKRLQKEGKVTGQAAAKAIAWGNQQVLNIQKSATNTTAALKSLRAALKIPPGETGAISVRTPTNEQKVLLGITTGETKFIAQDGGFYYFRPDLAGEEGAMVDANELNRIIEDGDVPWNTVPDISESLKGAYNNVVIPGVKDNADLVMFETKRVGDQEVTSKFMTTAQRQKAATAMVKGNQFKGILSDEKRMKSVWADLMGEDTDWGVVPEGEDVESYLKAQKDKAAWWLANKSLEDNAAPDGVKVIHSTSKYKPKEVKEPKRPTDLELAKQARYESYVAQSAELVGDAEAIANALTEVNAMDHEYEVVDLDYIESTLSDEEIEEYDKLEKEHEKRNYLRRILKDSSLNAGDIVNEEGDVIKGLDTQEGIEKALATEGKFSLDDQTLRSSKASKAAQEAYDSLPDDKKPTEDQRIFIYKGRKYINPNYKGDNYNQASKSFKDQQEDPELIEARKAASAATKTVKKTLDK